LSPEREAAERLRIAGLGRGELEEELIGALGRLDAGGAGNYDRALAMLLGHEFRTPLNAILGFGDLLLSGVSGPLSEEQRRQVESIADGGRRLSRLVEDLLELARAGGGSLDLSIEEFDLGFEAAEAAKVATAEARRKGLSIELLRAGEVHALGDRGRVARVMRHLLDNAVKFTQGGWIRIEVYGEDGRACFRVSDSGIGVAPEDRDRLFRPFGQLDGGLARHYGGAGLGLALSRLLVEAMGGRIWLEEPRGGTAEGEAGREPAGGQARGGAGTGAAAGPGSSFVFCLPSPRR
jgi:signal transduction histidine kinase